VVIASESFDSRRMSSARPTICRQIVDRINADHLGRARRFVWATSQSHSQATFIRAHMSTKLEKPRFFPSLANYPAPSSGAATATTPGRITMRRSSLRRYIPSLYAGVGAQLVGNQEFRHEALLFEQLAHEPHPRRSES
jgi:hypothetical protein